MTPAIPSKKLIVGLVVLGLLAGCLSTGGGADSPDEPPTETTRSEPASAQIYSILDSSDAVSEVLVNDTYVYEKGCFNPDNDSAVAFIRTGYHYQESESSKEAVGGELYRVTMTLSNDSVESVEKSNRIPDSITC
ncbi:hypothetical protein ACFQH6_19650 [Halobacteriaceae archaeon GCM10025711]